MHGGKRKGAGRPEGAKSDIKSKVTAAQILEGIGEEQAWKWAYATAKEKDDAKTVVDILKYLTDRRDGKAKQALDVNQQAQIVVQYRRDPETPEIVLPSKPQV